MAVANLSGEAIGGKLAKPAARGAKTRKWLREKTNRIALVEKIITHADKNGNGEKEKPGVKNKAPAVLRTPARIEVITPKDAKEAYFLPHQNLVLELAKHYSITFSAGRNPEKPLFKWEQEWTGKELGKFWGKLKLFVSAIDGKCSYECCWIAGNTMSGTGKIRKSFEDLCILEPKLHNPMLDVRPAPPARKEVAVQEATVPGNGQIEDAKLVREYLNRCKVAFSELGKTESILALVESADGMHAWRSDRMMEMIERGGKNAMKKYAGRVFVSLLNDMVSIRMGSGRRLEGQVEVFSIGQLDDAIRMLKELLETKPARRRVAAGDYPYTE